MIIKYKNKDIPNMESSVLYGQKSNDWTQFFTGGPDLGGQN